VGRGRALALILGGPQKGMDPRPQAAETPPPGGQIWKNYIFANGQRIAVREYTATASAVYFLLDDHLGSLNVTVDSNGNWVGSIRYTAFGEVRLQSGQAETEHKYTGQLSMGIGLYFYQSRMYDSALAHFTAADTLVPGAGNPLAWDRYSYVSWNPVNRVDPSGHKACMDVNANGQCVVDPDWHPSRRNSLFVISHNSTQSPTPGQLQTLNDQLSNVASSYAGVINASNRKQNWLNKKAGDPLIPLVTNYAAFISVHGGPIVITFSHEYMSDCAGRTFSKNQITFYNLVDSPNYLVEHPWLVVHEIGHAIDFVDGHLGNNGIGSYFAGGKKPFVQSGVDGLPLYDEYGLAVLNRKGLGGSLNSGQYGGDNSDEEVFADMVVGWEYGFWNLGVPEGAQRRDFMGSFMSRFLGDTDFSEG
jgi:RHS repeat-associated protein